MGFAFLFFGITLLLAGATWLTAHLPAPAALPLTALLLAAAASDLFTGILYLVSELAGVNPGSWFKRKDGTLRRGPRLLLWPYLAFEKWAWRRYRRRGEEPLFEPINDGLFQGARLLAEDEPLLQEAGINAVLDLVAEFEAPGAFRSNPAFLYLALPVLDGTAPSLADLEEGTDFILAAHQAGRKVLVHCTFGHGRSSTFTAAALLKSGLASSPDHALEILRRLQRRIWLSRAQKHRLRQFAARLDSRR